MITKLSLVGILLLVAIVAVVFLSQPQDLGNLSTNTSMETSVPNPTSGLGTDNTTSGTGQPTYGETPVNESGNTIANTSQGSEPTVPEVLSADYNKTVIAEEGQDVLFKDCIVNVAKVGEEPVLEFSINDYVSNYTLKEGSFVIDFFNVDIKKASDNGVSFEVSDASREVEPGFLAVGFLDPIKINGTDVRMVVTSPGTGNNPVFMVLDNGKLYSKDLEYGTSIVAGDYNFTFLGLTESNETQQVVFNATLEGHKYLFNITSEVSK